MFIEVDKGEGNQPLDVLQEARHESDRTNKKIRRQELVELIEKYDLDGARVHSADKG